MSTISFLQCSFIVFTGGVSGKYCHCAFFAEMFKDMIDEDLAPEEERAGMLEIKVRHIKRKYGDVPIAIGK